MEKTFAKPQLTISLLASNRPDSIRKCLDSLRPIMEQIPSELILVDTSKNPQIHEILMEYTEQVYEFEWCQDFAKARNVGLSKAKGEWFLFLDDDEWFVEIDELVSFFRSGEYKKYGYAHYQVRNFYDPNYVYYSDSWVSRMVRIDGDTRFKGKIHEHFYPVRDASKNIYALAYHSGYIFATEEQKRAHFERNATLLLEMMKEEPNNLRWQAQLAQEYRSVKEWDKLCEFCDNRIAATKHINERYDNIHLGTFYAGYATALLFLERYEKALELCQMALADKRNTELCKAYIYLSLAEANWKLGNYAEARSCVQRYLNDLEVLPRNEHLMFLQTMALYVNEAFDDTNIKKAYSILISCGVKQGSIEELRTYYERLGLNQTVVYVFDGTEKYLVEAMATMEYEPIFARIVTDGFCNRELRELMVNAAEEWGKRSEQAFRRIMYAYAEAESDDWYIWYAKLRKAGFEQDRELFESAIQGFYRTFLNVLAIPKEICEIAEALSVDIFQEWKNVSADRWKHNVRQYLQETGKEHLESTQKRIEEVFSPEDWKYQFVQIALLEKKVAKGPREPWNLMSYYETLEQLVEASLAFYGNYYREEAFVQYPDVLPETVQATVKIMEFLELESQDVRKALESLKESILLSPELADGIRKFMEQYPELEKQRARKHKEELYSLRDKVMAQVEEMLAKGQAKESLAIIAQLKQMLPNDFGVMELGLRARLKSLEE